MCHRLTVDVMADILERSRARGAAFAHTVAHGTWGLSLPPVPGLSVHVIVRGEAMVWIDDPAGARRVLPGELLLVRSDAHHSMASDPSAPCVPLSRHLADGRLPGSSRRHRLGEVTDEESAEFFCGAYLFDGDLCSGLLGSLPDLLVQRPAAGSRLRVVADLLAREVQDEGPGQQTLLDRLLDVALVHLLRAHFAATDRPMPAYIAAGADPGVNAALEALHEDPAHPWTVAELARRASLSRATFARRFHELLGATPLGYLTDWRMALARERLRDTDDGLAAVAAAVGYSSEFSFAAAFKRAHGTAPGRWRKEARLAGGG